MSDVFDMLDRDRARGELLRAGRSITAAAVDQVVAGWRADEAEWDEIHAQPHCYYAVGPDCVGPPARWCGNTTVDVTTTQMGGRVLRLRLSDDALDALAATVNRALLLRAEDQQVRDALRGAS